MHMEDFFVFVATYVRSIRINRVHYRWKKNHFFKFNLYEFTKLIFLVQYSLLLFYTYIQTTGGVNAC